MNCFSKKMQHPTYQGDYIAPDKINSLFCFYKKNLLLDTMLQSNVIYSRPELAFICYSFLTINLIVRVLK